LSDQCIPFSGLREGLLREARPLTGRRRARVRPWALFRLRVLGPARVRLHADLTILAKVACTVAIARAVRVAAYRRLDRIPRRAALVRALIACGGNAGLLKRRREPFASTIRLTTDALVVPALSGHHRQPYSDPRPSSLSRQPARRSGALRGPRDAARAAQQRRQLFLATVVLSDGTLTLQGVSQGGDDAPDIASSITGGTGAYAGERGLTT
jgi:hypothetical protein